MDAVTLGLAQADAKKRYSSKLATLARVMPRDPAAIYQLSSETPTITAVANERTTAITGGVYRLPKAVTNGSHEGVAVDIANDPHFRFLGTPSLTYGSGFPANRFCTTPLLTNGASQSAYWWGRASFQYDGRYLDVIFRAVNSGHSYRLKINGRFLTESTQTLTGLTNGAGYRLVIDFGTAAQRLIEYEFASNPFGGVIIEPTASIFRGPKPQLTFMGFGDSITAGANEVARGDKWPTRVAQMLGCDDWQNAGIGGSGAVAAPAFTSRIGDITTMNPDVIVIWGGQNELGGATPIATMQAAYTAFVNQVKTALPRALIFLVGMWVTGTPDANRMSYHAALKAAAAATGVPFIDTIDPMGLAAIAPAFALNTQYLQGDAVVYNTVPYVSTAEANSGSGFPSGNFRATSFIYGTGKVGSTTGLGNSDVAISSDSTHPTQAGEDIIERFLGYQLRRRIIEMAGAANLGA